MAHVTSLGTGPSFSGAEPAAHAASFHLKFEVICQSFAKAETLILAKWDFRQCQERSETGILKPFKF